MTDPHAQPSTNGDNGGRTARGTFAKGNAGGPGNPHAKRVARLRSALLRAVTPEDIKAIIRKLVESAKSGDVPAAREVLSRLFGPYVATDLEDRIAKLENVLGAQTDAHGTASRET
ncbi:MAG TPA: hypothetical protein PLF81_26230 [Candidatus Anammoximicrobium sp.]|nr:hypothetical protein [Candidatus Anammoximicrobium sp.]